MCGTISVLGLHTALTQSLVYPICCTARAVQGPVQAKKAHFNKSAEVAVNGQVAMATAGKGSSEKGTK